MGRYAKIRAYHHPMRFALYIQKTGQPSLAARFLMVWVRLSVKHLLLPLLFSVHLPLTARCFLRAAHCELFFSKHFVKRAKEPAFRSSTTQPRLSAVSKKFIRPQKKFPGAGPRAYRICNTICNPGGLRWGRSRRGRLGGTGLSLRGGSLQGLLQRWEP